MELIKFTKREEPGATYFRPVVRNGLIGHEKWKYAGRTKNFDGTNRYLFSKDGTSQIFTIKDVKKFYFLDSESSDLYKRQMQREII